MDKQAIRTAVFALERTPDRLRYVVRELDTMNQDSKREKAYYRERADDRTSRE